MGIDLKGVDAERLQIMVFSLFGYDLLANKDARHIVLSNAPPAALAAISNALGISSAGKKPYDLAFEISGATWTSGSNAPWVFARELGIPRDYLPQHGLRPDPIELVEPRESIPPPFPYQLEVIGQLSSFFESARQAAIVQLPTGTGKTRVAIEAIIRLMTENGHSGGILWMAHTEELCDQAFETFRRLWIEKGDRDLRLGRFWGTYRTPLQELYGEVVFAGFQKLLSLYKKDPQALAELSTTLRVVVIDEAHKSLGQETKTLIQFLRSNANIKLVGLTATPGRSLENMTDNRKLARLFDDDLITATSLGDTPINHLQNEGILAKVHRRQLQTGTNISLSEAEITRIGDQEDLPKSVLDRIAGDETRNQVILEEVISQAKSGKSVLVFACSVEHAKRLALMTSLLGIGAGFVSHDTRRSTRRRLIQEFRNGRLKVMYNYGVLSTGFDAPNIGTIVIARPTSSIVLYSQMIGRGMRGTQVGGDQNVELIELSDNFNNFGDVDAVYSYFEDYWA